MEKTLAEKDLLSRYQSVRSLSEKICEPLEPEDVGLQCMPDSSPPKWHLAHSSWFFEQFLLKEFVEGYECYDSSYTVLFNSYYNKVGQQHPRADRGHLSRPLIRDVYLYRKHIDQCMGELIGSSSNLQPEIEKRIHIGLNHEEQHQELLLTDIKYNFFCNPLHPEYLKELEEFKVGEAELTWKRFSPGLTTIGSQGDRFSYDNEHPAHQVFVGDFMAASRLVTNGEYREFIDSGAYQNSDLWLSDGWDYICKNNISSPLYWHGSKKDPVEFTLGGDRALMPLAPVSHLSFFEADAFACWTGNRLLYEREWEAAARDVAIENHFLLNEQQPQESSGISSDWFNINWQWTIDSYLSYPGYAPEEGALGEYNGKFMCNQKVLKGGSRYTPAGHIRSSYRNFLPTDARWQRNGIRLAKSI